MIIKLEVPISDYCGEEVFFKSFYFEVEDRSPTKEQIINALEKLHHEYQQYDEYTGEEAEAIQILKKVEDWRYVGQRLAMTNTFVEHPDFGKQPVTWSVIKPITIKD